MGGFEDSMTLIGHPLTPHHHHHHHLHVDDLEHHRRHLHVDQQHDCVVQHEHQKIRMKIKSIGGIMSDIEWPFVDAFSLWPLDP